jgi:hypothetical protein
MSSLDKMWTLLNVRIDDAGRLSDDDFWRPFFMGILKGETRRLAVVSPFGPDVKYYAAHVRVEGLGNRERLCIVDNSGCVIVVRHHPDDVESLTAANPTSSKTNKTRSQISRLMRSASWDSHRHQHQLLEHLSSS